MGLSLSSIYRMRTKTLLYDSFALYLKGFPFTLLFALGMLTPLLLDYISIVLLRYGLLILVLVVIAPFLFLGYELYLAHLYDQNLNASFPGQLYRGLYHPKTETK